MSLFSVISPRSIPTLRVGLPQGSASYNNVSVASEIQGIDPLYPQLVVAESLWANGSVGYFSDINSGSPAYKKETSVVGGNAYIAQNNGGSSVAYGSLKTGAALPSASLQNKTYLQGMSAYWGSSQRPATPA